MKIKKKIVIIGAGFGGIYALRELHHLFHDGDDIEVSLVNEKNYFLFTPLLHEVATGGINPDNIAEPIRKIFGCCYSNLYLGKAEHVDLDKKIVKVGEEEVSYDYLVITPGAQTSFYNIPGAEEHSFTLKSLDDAIKLKNHCITQIERASHEDDKEVRESMLTFVVVGGGPTGVELAVELNEFLKESFLDYYPKEVIEKVKVILVQKAGDLLPQFGQKLRDKSLSVLRNKGVEVMLNCGVIAVEKDAITFDIGAKKKTQTVIWVAGIKPAQINFDSPVQKTPDGKIIVNEFLQIEGHPNVFAIGDAAAVSAQGHPMPLPALAQVAIAEASAVADNIKAEIQGKPLTPFTYKHKGNLVSLGSWMAAGEIHHFSFWGHLTWWIWRTVYLSKLISRTKRIKVALDWTLDLFSPRDIAQL